MTTLRAIMKYVNRPKSTTKNDIDIDIDIAIDLPHSSTFNYILLTCCLLYLYFGTSGVNSRAGTLR